jgi:hypothetical protein
MRGHLRVKQVFIPLECVKGAYQHMRKMGEQGFEGVALFAGKESGESFIVTTTLVPQQTALSIEYGLLYSVSGEELHRLNVFLYENELSLIAQIHSHPKEAFHSDTDDASPIVTTVGGISIVVPDFASGAIDVRQWAVYRLSVENEWKELMLSEKQELKDALAITQVLKQGSVQHFE